jgi:glycosyltransferase involved in cell wall biosynthesis
VLFTTPVLEHPPRGGPELRIENSIKALASVADLHIVSRLSREAIGGAGAESFYRELARSFAYAPSVGGLAQNRYLRRARRGLLRDSVVARDARALVERATKLEVDAMWLGYGNISFDVIHEVKRIAPHIPLVCDTDSVWSRFVLRELPLEQDPGRRAAISKKGVEKEEEERAWVALCEVTTAVSEVDAEYYRAIAPDPARVALFPNVIDLASYTDGDGPPPGLRSPSIFLAGTFGAPTSPMNRAADWLIARVLPLVTSEIPDAKLYLIGRRSRESFAGMGRDDVVVVGEVASVVPYLTNSDVSVVPLSYESGTRFKILEAGACRVPVVSTTLGAEGLPVEHERDVLLADEPSDFAREIVRVLRDRDLATRLAAGLEELVSTNFSVGALSRQAEVVIETAVRA